MFTLNDKKTLITGATGGIGGAIAEAYYQAGAHLALSGSRQEKLDSVAGELGPRAHALACNLNVAEEVASLVARAEDTLGGLDVLVCNAGITRDMLALRMKDEDWQAVIDINLTASFKLARAACKGMLKRRAGRIIFITSVVGWTGNAGQTNYCAAKAGVTGMAKALSHEVAGRGITVNCIAPGFIETPMTDVLTIEQKQGILKNVPLGKLGSPQDIAAGAVYLASDAAAYITGHTLHINGGMYMN